jgi:hypothetical protein
MLSLFKTLLFAVVAACLITSTMASAAPKGVHVDGMKWSCKAKERGYLVINYDVRIGRPYTKQKCAEAYRNLQRNSAVSAYKCNRLSGGHMQLKFNNLRGSAYSINSAMNKSFPGVAHAHGWFNCPDH